MIITTHQYLPYFNYCVYLKFFFENAINETIKLSLKKVFLKSSILKFSIFECISVARWGNEVGHELNMMSDQ
jgi:hypothetical protein